MGLNFRKINEDDFPNCAKNLVAAYNCAPWYNNLRNLLIWSNRIKV